MRLEWSPLAMADREAIFDSIEADRPLAAVAIDKRIERDVARLREFPEIGRAGRVEGTRELVVRRTPYIVAYIVGRNTVRVLRVLHGARIWPEEMPR